MNDKLIQTPNLQNGQVYFISRVTLGLIWLYLAIFPKVIFIETAELDILRAGGIFNGYEKQMLFMLGLGELALGLAFLLLWKQRIVYWCNIVCLIMLTLTAAIMHPYVFVEPFNPASLGAAMIALSFIGLQAPGDQQRAERLS